MNREPLFRRYRRFWGADSARDVDDELALHLEMRIDELTRAGLTEQQAREATMKRFGDYARVRQECQDLGRMLTARHRRADRWSELTQDVRYAARGLLTHRAFSIAVILTMAIGIGANSAVFSVAYGVLFRPLPYRDQEELIRLWSRNAERQLEFFSVSPADLAEWQKDGTAFAGMAAFERQRDATLVRGARGAPEAVQTAAVQPALFALLGSAAVLGRALAPADAAPGAPPVAVISHTLWVTRFGGDSAAVGADVLLDGRRLTIVGVMPPRFAIPGTPAPFWTPLDLSSAPVDHGNRYLRVLARLSPGVTLTQAQSRLDLVAARLGAEFPGTNASWRVNALNVTEMVVGPEFSRAVRVLLGVVIFILLIAGSNAANLQLARAASRRREIAVRAALGAGTWRILRQLLTESIMLCTLGGMVGLVLAWRGIEVLRAVGDRAIPRLDDVQLDAPVLVFTSLVTLLAGLLFGLTPALRASRFDIANGLKEGGRETTGRGAGQRVRGALVISEVSLSLVLLIGAGLLMRSFERLQDVNLGFEPRGVSLAPLRLPEAAYSDPQRIGVFQASLLDGLRTLPGIESAALVTAAPFFGPNAGLPYVSTDKPVDARSQASDADYRVVSPGYFQTLGIGLLRGRDFTNSDVPTSPAAVIISESMARAAWPGGEPLGKRIRVGDHLKGPELTVVGVVSDARYQSREATEVRSMMYFALSASPERAVTIAIKGGDASMLSARVREVVASLDPALPAPVLTNAAEPVGDAIATPRFALVLFAVFASIAVVLATIGIYGVMSYLVRQRTQEMGIRIALGSSRMALIRTVVGRALLLTLAGVGLGLVVARMLSGWMDDLLFGISPTDPATYAAFALLLCVVAVSGSLIPAWRATRADPLDAIRGTLAARR
jgi:putative ABC transport system permease protein